MSSNPAYSIVDSNPMAAEKDNDRTSRKHMRNYRHAFRTAHEGMAREGLSVWIWEVVCLGAAVACLVSIFWLLFDSDGKRQEDWTLSIGLNSLVAILSTVFRSSLEEITGEVISQLKWAWIRTAKPLIHLQFLDDASRGPYGASLLLLRLRRLSFAHLGCFITLLAYAIGPFIQQAIRNELCSLEVPGAHAVVPLAMGQRVGWYAVTRYAAGQFAMNTGTKASIINAIADPEVGRANLLSGCTTGNCSFSATDGISHATLGFCSLCSDTTSMLEEVIGPAGQVRLTLPNGQYLVNSSYSAMNFSMGFDAFNGLEFDPDLNATLSFAMSSISLITLTSTPCTYTPPPNGTVGSWVCSDKRTTTIDSYWDTVDVISAACGIYPCMRKYSADVNNGELREVLKKVTPAVRGSSSAGTDAVVLDENCVVDGSAINSSEVKNITTTFTGADETYSGNLDFQTIEIPPQCMNKISFPYLGGISQLMSSMFAGYCGSPGVETGGPFWKDPAGRQRLLCYDTLYPDDLTSGDAGRGGWWLQGLGNKGNATFESIQHHMSLIADVMTDRLRLENFNSSDSRTYVQGKVMQTTVCTKLNWPWLLLPVGLLILTAVFLIITIAWSILHANEIPLWKGSTLPLLFSSSSDLSQTQPQTVKEMESAAKNISVQLHETDGRNELRLRRADEHVAI